MHLLKREPKASDSVIYLKDATPEDWKMCEGLHHVPTSYQYGTHPNRVYQWCPFCRIKSRLDWKDTYARTMNRLWTTTPAVITGTMLIATIAFILWAAAHIP